ncbi:hypothetical protein ACFOE1_14115 [Agromyces mediolanus]|uniref:Gram-positive cocci surface proteins LPxTG domain-containing protein n=1 Tax=Agromyces mediolanus TaxID=41986 RepID=A0A918FAE5_AGRME|nr:hypothetical protein [Agromyces mediolanus]GGR21107.1 hypothetical protein GCM10010196_13120 [Agromyces mediolanus]GLJ73756.1 hypothetical protein GCM10017583_30150 [Agromyces mediolanus]
MTSTPARIVPAALAAGLLFAAVSAAAPAAADSAPAAECRTNCTTVFDTAGLHTISIPAGVVSLQATVSGAAGSPAAAALGLFPDAVGGAGGVSTVTLGTSLGGSALTVLVGGAGQGSALADAAGALLVVAGGGGDGGYAGRFELPDQLFAAYPGGAGGAPNGPGVAPGGEGTTFGTGAFNGAGGGLSGGAGGTGGASGDAGEAGTSSAPGTITLSAGGAGGTLAVQDDRFQAGAGGGGYTGGGGGAVALDAVDGGDEIMIDVVGAGGGGSGFLADGLAAVAGEPNPGAASVTLVWSLPPLPAPEPVTPAAEPAGPPLAETGAEPLPFALGALLVVGAGAGLLAARRRRTA